MKRCNETSSPKTNIQTNHFIAKFPQVCDGDGSSCGNCDKKSGKDVDRCGQCLLPTSAEFNTGCFKLVSLNPSSASSIGGEIVELQGAGITDDVTCSLLLGNTAHALVNEKGERNSVIFNLRNFVFV